MLALKVLPENKKQKMRATIQISLGNLVAHMLEYCINEIRKKKEVIFTPADIENVNREHLLFEGFDQPFPKITLATDLDGCK